MTDALRAFMDTLTPEGRKLAEKLLAPDGRWIPIDATGPLFREIAKATVSFPADDLGRPVDG